MTGRTHAIERIASLWALYGLAMLAALPASACVGWASTTAFALGYASHVALDVCTMSEVLALWPPKRRYQLMPRELRIVTGGLWEGLWMVALATAIFGLLH